MIRDAFLHRLRRLIARPAAPAGALAAAVLFLYGPYILLHPEFVMDDFYHLFLLDRYGIVHPFLGEVFYYFAGLRVIPAVSLFVDHLVFGLEPLGYYFSNVAIFIAVVIAAFHLLRRLYEVLLDGGSRFAAFAVALLMVVHSEFGATAYWISNRTESLMLLFYLLSLHALLSWLLSARTRDLLLGVLFFLLAIWSKAQAAHLPLLFLLLWSVLRRGGRSPHSMGAALAASLPLFLVSAAYLIVVVQYDPRLGNVPWSYIPEKLMAVVGISLIGLATPVAEPVYAFFVHHKPVAYAVGGLLGVASAALMFRLSPARRRIAGLLLALYLVSLYPRIAYVVYERINTVQALVLLFMLGLLLASLKRRHAVWLTSLLVLFHLAGSVKKMAAWSFISDNGRYHALIDAERGKSRQYYKLVTYQVFDPYAMFFLRHGSIGYDSTFHNSPILLVLHYGSHAGLDYAWKPIPGGYRYSSADNRTTFMYDSSAQSRYGLRLQPVRQEKDYEYLEVDVVFDEDVRPPVFLIERNYRYEIIKNAGEGLPLSLPLPDESMIPGTSR